MDEALGGCLAVIIGIAVVVAIVGAILIAIWTTIVTVAVNVMLALDTALSFATDSSPVLAWAAFGALIGLMIGMWKEAPRYGHAWLQTFALVIPVMLLGGGLLWRVNARGLSDIGSAAQAATAIAARATPTPAPLMATITGSVGANLRSEPSKSGRILSLLARGSRVSIVGVVGDWYVVQTASAMRGYVHKSLVHPDTVR